VLEVRPTIPTTVSELHPDGRAGIDAALVRRLIAAQFPQWRELSVMPVAVDGWDNRTYRLGAEMSVRLPTAARYAPAVEKEDRWLPILTPSLPVDVPTPLATGRPGEGYPFCWSVRPWLDGRTALEKPPVDLASFALSIAEFLVALQRIDATDGPIAGRHSFYRGESLHHYDGETRECLQALRGRIDTDAAATVWDAALATTWDRAPVWFHGDVASGNLLVRDDRLSAVIDFGTCGVGDPACDLVIAWTFLSGRSREIFRDRVRQDADTWARARAWVLWKALIGLGDDADDAAWALNLPIIEEVIADYERRS
jgi:aminoglycoside phosphotransferase (APT) family kinase protein